MQEKRIHVWLNGTMIGSLMLLENWNPAQVQIMHSYETLRPYLPTHFKTVHPTMQEAVAYVQQILPGKTVEHESGNLAIFLASHPVMAE